jgi:hypothetical protein
MRFLLSVSLAAFLAGAVHAQAPRIVVQPPRIELTGNGARHGILVTAIATDGSTRDVTREAKFASSHDDIVAVSPAGECRTVRDGDAAIVIEAIGQTASVSVVVKDANANHPPSFVNDVEPILTRFGCNMGACHGKGAGQNGFRLSLRGYAPEWDYGWITREFDNRRVNTGMPEASLLVRKPLGEITHEGGKLLRPDGRETQTLLEWIRAGVPAPKKDESTVRGLEILPGNRQMKVGQEQQLLVRAEFSDGAWKDVTWVTQFAANDQSVAEVSPGGLVKMVREGETAVRATYQGQVAVVMVAAPHAKAVSPEVFAKKNNFIDEHVFKKLADLHIEPSPLCRDDVFLRRVYLDTIGVLPTPDEVRAFAADTREDKRAHVIESLFERPEFVDFWALQLGDLLQNRRESDHDVRGSKGVRAMHQWIRHQVAINRPWDEMAKELLTSTGSADDNPAIGYFIVTVGEQRDAHRSPVVASAAQTFLGTRIGCAQCHNHPSEKYTQDDYYHFAGFFSRISFSRKDPKQGTTTLRVGTADKNQSKGPVGVSQPRTNKFLPAQPLDRSKIEIGAGDDPRAKLADWIVNPANEAFAGAMVNRLWAHFLGVGLVEPIDDLRASNPPTNPGLWKALVKEFADHKFDRRQIMRVILNSRTYQLSSIPTESNVRDSRFYSHYYARRLPAEVLLDALSSATGVPDRFEGYPVGVRAAQVPDPAVKSYFLGLFGRSERLTACTCERNNEVTLPQLLHMSGGQTITQKLRDPEGRLRTLVHAKMSDRELADEVFLVTLGRLPSAAERRQVDSLATREMDAAAREDAYRDLFWALLNTKEFAFNH